MYNRKSRTSAILALVTAVLLIGFMVMLFNLQYKQQEGDNFGTAIALAFVIMFSYIFIIEGVIVFTVFALIFGIKILKQQARRKLIILNVWLLITSCLNLISLVIGVEGSQFIIFNSTLGVFPIIYTVIVSLSYVSSLVADIVTIILLKKSPKEQIPEQLPQGEEA